VTIAKLSSPSSLSYTQRKEEEEGDGSVVIVAFFAELHLKKNKAMVVLLSSPSSLSYTQRKKKKKRRWQQRCHHLLH
jgi:hypothetical protein